MKYKIKNVHKTLFIKERYQILSERNDNSLNNFSLNNWRSTMSIISEKTFEEMLKLNNYNKKIFSNTVNYDYTEEQIRLYSEYAKNSEWYKFAEGSFEIFRKHPQRINFKKDFSRILEPFIINLLKLINNYLENKEYEWIDKNGNIFSSLVFYLEDLIYPWIVKPLVLEINSLREKGLLEGESEQQRYKYFITLFDKEENILNFYNKYPVLLRQISESCLRFYTYFIEILSNLENDFSVLEEELGLRGKLNDIKFGKGDTHSQGKTVLILFFDDAKIVYKPKNLIINNSLNTIAEYIRKVDEKIRIRIPRTIAYSDHSYEEFIDYLPLEQKKKLPEYYYNFGVLLAFIYLFNGSDIHFENLISYGDMPVIIDFETMLQQPLFDDKTGQSLLDTLFHRVTRTLLLPTEGVKREDGLDVEMSALTGNFKKDAFNGQVLINLNTDKVKFDIGKIDFEGGKNLPVRDGDIEFDKYIKDFKKGFRDFYLIFEELNKTEEFKMLLKANLYGLKTRVLFRDTNSYASVLSFLYHPDFYEEMLDREKALENLWSNKFSNQGIVASECEQMRLLDIPIFYTDTNINEIYDDFGNHFISLHQFSGYDYFMKYLPNNNLENLEKQLDIIEIYFPSFDQRKKGYKLNLSNRKKLPNESLVTILHNEVENIADSLVINNIYDEYPIWSIPVNFKGSKWCLEQTGNDMYRGRAGILLFMYYVKLLKDKSSYTQLYNKMLSAIPPSVSLSKTTFGLTGDIGYFIVLSIIEDYDTNTLACLNYIKSILTELEKTDFASVSNKSDYINGLLPLINTLVRYYRRGIEKERVLRLVLSLGDTLYNDVSERDNSNFGYSFGHGLSGVIFTLKNIYKVTRLKKYKELILQLVPREKIKIHSLKWCSGEFGTLVNHPQSVPEGIVASLDNDTFCHGSMAIINFYIDYMKEMDTSMELESLLCSVVMNKSKEGEYRIVQTSNFPDFSLYTGVTGIAYTFLRYIALNQNDKKIVIPSLLEI